MDQGFLDAQEFEFVRVLESAWTEVRRPVADSAEDLLDWADLTRPWCDTTVAVAAELRDAPVRDIRFPPV